MSQSKKKRGWRGGLTRALAWPLARLSLSPSPAQASLSLSPRNTVPFRMLRMVPLGDFHIFLSPNSATRASSGVMVAHLMPTPHASVALAASTVTASSVASRWVTDRS